jgi:hypothetical protein
MDNTISIIDILICIIDLGVIFYLFFYRVRQEKKKNKFDKFGYYRIKKRR